MEKPVVTTKNLPELLTMYLRARVNPIVFGDPGTGKSSIARAVAESLKLWFIDCRLTTMEPPQLNGLENLNKETQKTEMFSPAWLPTEDDTPPEGYDGWLIIWDEMADADDCVLKAMYKILNEREVNQKKLHPRCLQVALSNDPDSGCFAQPLPDAVQSRVADIYLQSDKDAFIEVCHKAGINTLITSYLQFRPEFVNTYRTRPEGVANYACQRVWFQLNELLTANNIDITTHEHARVLLHSLLDPGTADDFLVFSRYRNEIPDMTRIKNSPDMADVPEETGLLFALAGKLGDEINKDNAPALVTYIDRMPKRFQVVTMLEITRRNSELLDEPALEDWIDRNGLPQAA